VSSLESRGSDRYTAVDAVAGLMAASSIALSAIALVDRPARLAPVAIIVALVAARMSRRFQRLGLAAALIGGIGWVLGMTFAVITENPII